MVNTGNRLPGVNLTAKGWITEDMLSEELGAVQENYTPPTGAYDDPIVANGNNIWVDDNGLLRISSSTPNDDEDGSLIAEQTEEV